MQISRFQVVTAFEVDEAIVLTCGAQLKELGGKLNGRVMSVNIPEGAPPELPRIVLPARDSMLNVALNRFEILSTPPDHVATSMEASIAFIKNRVTPILETLIRGGIEYHWTGVIAEIEFPTGNIGSGDPVSAVRPVYRRLTTVGADPQDLISFSLQLGFSRGDFFRHYSLSGYSKSRVELAQPNQRRSAARKIQGGLVECGVQVSLDVNNKPTAIKAGPVSDFHAVLDEILAASLTIRDDLNLGDTLP